MSQRFLPLIGTAFLAATLSTATLQAGASNKNGNPFGNGTYFNDSGTFSAVIRGQNLSGTVLFSTGANTNLSSSGSSGGGSQSITNTGFGIQGVSPGSSVVVYEGYTYQGNAAGMWNPASGSVSGQFWGGQTLSGSNSTTVFPEIYNSNSFPTVLAVLTNTVTNVQTVVIDPTTGFATTNSYLTNQVTTNFISVEPVGTNNYQDSVYMNGSFDGTMQNQYPNQTFTAYGTALQQQIFPQQVGPYTNSQGVVTEHTEGIAPAQMLPPTQIPIIVQGVRVSDSYSTFNTISNAVPYSQTSYTMTNIGTF